jgi:hypothetical protein
MTDAPHDAPRDAPHHDAARAVVADRLDRRDTVAVAALTDVDTVYVNDSRWWQNASFALPLLVCVIALGVGLALRSPEAIGFGLFLAVVTLIMVPVVLLTRDGATALHHGRVLHELRWPELRRIERVEYLGNTRHKLVHGADERFLTVESEIEGADDLVDRAFALSGLPRASAARDARDG